MKGKDLTERVYKEMKKDIMIGKIPCNELFSEQMLAETYHCSRTPAREAAGQLVIEGFLNKYPSKGYIIRLPTKREMHDMRYCRYVLECAALEQALHIAYTEDIKNLYRFVKTPQDNTEESIFSNMVFHCQLASLANNQTLVEMIERLHCRMLRNEVEQTETTESLYGYLTGPAKEPAPAPLVFEPNNHKAIVDAMVERDIEKAKEMMKQDIYPGSRAPESAGEKRVE